MEKQEIDHWLSLHRRARLAKGLLKARDGTAWRARDYQKVSLESWASRKVHCDGRDVGKTSEIEIMALWAMIARPRTEMLIAAQCENHLFPLMNRVVRRFEEIPALKKSLVEIRRTPSWFLRFSNGFVLWGRIAGPRGMNFQGLHVDWQIVDEAQEMTETGWGELYQSLNGGGRRWVYGVPNGLRNAFFRMTQSPEAEQYNWPSSLNPEFTAEKDAELVRLYGGKGAPGYLHRVLGQHGAPSHGVFDLDDYLACVDEGLEFVEAVLREDDAFAAPESIGRGAYYLGCDLGYARDPSEFVVYRANGPDLINVARFRLEGVNYSRQQSIITELDLAYDFRAVGIDSGNNGRAVSHALMAEGIEWCEKITAIEFGSSIDLGELPDGSARRRPVKEFMTELLRRGMADRSLVFPKMAERESQYAAHTYTVGHQGRIVYEKGNDHIIDADRCAMLCHYLDTHSVEQPRLGVRVEGF